MAKLYLSGGMEYKKNLGKKWRDWFTEKLEEQRHDAINPVKLESLQDKEDEEDDEAGFPLQTKLSALKEAGKLNKVRKIVRDSLFRKDMFAIQLADAIVVLYDESAQKGAGTLSESWEAFREGVPVYLVTDFPMSDVPTWLIGETTQIFADFEELLEYTKDHSHIIRDQMDARQIAADCLGSIYGGSKSR